MGVDKIMTDIEKQHEIDLLNTKDDNRDSSITLWGVLILCGLFIVGLFVGEFGYNKNYLTPELIHSLGGFLLGSALMCIVQGLFQKQVGKSKPNGSGGIKP